MATVGVKGLIDSLHQLVVWLFCRPMNRRWTCTSMWLTVLRFTANHSFASVKRCTCYLWRHLHSTVLRSAYHCTFAVKLASCCVVSETALLAVFIWNVYCYKMWCKNVI